MDISELTRTILDRREKPEDPLRIVQAGHPALRRRSVSAVGRLEPELQAELIDAMTVTMRRAPGVGLAAPQVGLPLRLIVVEDRYASAPGEDEDDDLLERRPLALRALLDPTVEILGTETVHAWEGCLSVDGWQSIVPRARRVRLRALEIAVDGTDPAPREIDEELVGWTARILQHETDHLRGTLCHDRAVPRSFVDASYVPHYADLSEAVRLLGLEGDVTRLAPGEVLLDSPADGGSVSPSSSSKNGAHR
ncbi:peptide deformylase [Brachybacterium sp. DNPG3]